MNKYDKMLKKTLFHIAKIEEKKQKLYSRILETTEDCCVFEIQCVLYDCIEKDDCLYDRDEKKIARDGLVDGLYYCDQSTGYCEDDFYGYMYYKIDEKGTFVKVYYNC